jgi:trk system potassium uptake protein TrkA
MAKRTFAVIGLGRFGSAVASTLAELGQEVIGVDSDEERVQEMADLVNHAVAIDAVDLKALRQAGVQDVDVAIISIGENIESSLLVVMQVKELGVKEVIAKAVTPLHGKILQKLGVTRVVYPEREMAMRIAHSLVVPNVLDYIELSRDVSIVELPAPAEFLGKTLRDLALRQRFGLTLIAIKRRSGTGDGELTNVAPGPDDHIFEGDVLSLLGDNDRLSQLDRLLRR